MLSVTLIMVLLEKKFTPPTVRQKKRPGFDSVGRKIYNARFGPGYKFNVPAHILNNPNYVVHYLE